MALTMESAVGYVVAEDVYIVYSEYYGDGTIYGRVNLLLNGEPVRGAGKSKKELVEAGVVLSETVGSVNGDLVAVPDSNEVVAEVAAPCVCSCGSVCACACSCPPECACVVPAASSPDGASPEASSPVEASPEASSPDGASPEVAVEASPPCSGRYTVSLNIAGFTVTREFNVKINEESRQIYLD